LCGSDGVSDVARPAQGVFAAVVEVLGWRENLGWGIVVLIVMMNYLFFCQHI
jgi:hypothetical protein